MIKLSSEQKYKIKRTSNLVRVYAFIVNMLYYKPYLYISITDIQVILQSYSKYEVVDVSKTVMANSVNKSVHLCNLNS